MYEAVKRGDLCQMSFAFDIGARDFDSQTRTATITAISKIYEISIVNFAAYKQTNVQARNSAKKSEREGDFMSTISTTGGAFNPIESAVFAPTAAQTNLDPHASPEYRAAFYKALLGQQLTDAENRAYTAARAEKRADAFNTLTSSAAIVPETTLNEIINPQNPISGLFGEIRKFSVSANLAVLIGMPTDPAAWHTEGAPVDRNDITTHYVSFGAFELIKIISMSAAAKRMSISAFEQYIIAELRQSVIDAIGVAIISGTGAGQPKGILSGIMWGASNSVTSAGARFAMSTATLFNNVYPIKTAMGDYIFMEDPEKGGVRRLFGFEIVLDENVPQGTVLFGNFRYYGVNIPHGVAIETRRESGFTSGLIDFRALCIVDAKPIVPEAFVKLTVGAA